MISTSSPWPAGDRVTSVVRLLDRESILEGRTPESWQDFTHEANEKPRLATIHDARDRQGDRVFMDLRSRCTSEGLLWTIGAIVDLEGRPRFERRELTVPFTCHSDSSVAAPQRGSTTPILVSHLNAQPAYRDGHLWVFEAKGRSAQDSTSAIHGAELDVQRWPEVRLLQLGRVGSDGSHAFAPAAALDHAGNLVVIFTQSSEAEYLSAYYTGRLATDPPNSMRPPQLIKAGERPFVWAEIAKPDMSFIDYQTVALDPVDGSLWLVTLLPTARPPASGRAEQSDAWIARLQPLQTP